MTSVNKTPFSLNQSAISLLKAYKKSNDSSLYLPFLNYLRQVPPPPKLCCHWLLQLQDFIPLLNKSTEKIVIDTLQIPWQHGEEDVQLHIRNFTLSLVTGHNYYVAPVLECLLKQLMPTISEDDSDALKVNPYQLTKERELANYKTLDLIHTIYLHVPLCKKVLLTKIRDLCPYFDHHVHIHTVFTYNILMISHLNPELKSQILEIILTNCIKLDLHCPRVELQEEDDEDGNEIFSMEMDKEEIKSVCSPMSHPVSHTLDTLMAMLFRYIHLLAHGGIKKLTDISHILEVGAFEVNGCYAGSAVPIKGLEMSQLGVSNDSAEVASTVTDGCSCQGSGHDAVALRGLYLNLKQLLRRIVLPTCASDHTQFLMFFTLALRPPLVSDFLDSMKVIFEDPSSFVEERKNALFYLGSFLARARFVKFSHVHSSLEILRDWCQTYLCSKFVNDNKFEDLQLHHLFYVVCQTLFYVFTFNYKEYTESKRRLKLAQSLHLDELVLSPLNPLRFTNPALNLNLAAITYYYQLAYCYSVLESNTRLFLPVCVQNSCGEFEASSDTLEAFYPFDPYLLKRSHPLIIENYREFPGLPEEILRHSKLAGRMTKEIAPGSYEMDESLLWPSPKSKSFSCGTSPFSKGV